MTNNILVVAFDGLDYELIEDFGLENIPQEEFGTIDNDTGVSERKTSELFASFITGETHEEHGIEGVGGWTNDNIEKFEGLVEGITFFDRFRMLRHSIFESIRRLDAQKTFPDKSKLDNKSIFDKLENTRALFVPGYNPGSLWQLGPWKMMDHGLGPEKMCKEWDAMSYRRRKRDLFNELENDIISPRDLLMCHFHRPDIYQHIYDSEDEKDRSKIKNIYTEIDQLAGEIKSTALEQGYDTIVFMSDHGMPTSESHNKNAFYSCNKELFGNEKPHITEFYDKFLELVEK